ncbi:MAG: protein kinase domain-containing protein, partial [Gemmatimonadaceae bacterium]
MTTDPLGRLTRALADRYRVEHVLGEGGMATVYLAHDLKHHRQVAIKVLKPDVAAAVGADRFLREIAIAAKLNYPHIVPLFDSGEADGLVFYVMPYIAGESLRDRLRREKQLPVDDAISIVRQVAAALTYAAAHGIIHRDIKPDNVLLIDGTAMVADFGIARAIVESGPEHLTATGGAIGTPAYMSPEQASGGRNLDARSDVYALGCVLYESLAGEPPYTGPTFQSIVAQHLGAPVPQVRHLRDLVPTPVDVAITRALAKLPADRFASALEFANALTQPADPRSGDPAYAVPHELPMGAAARAPRRAIWGVLTAIAILAALFISNIGGLRDRLTGTKAALGSRADGRRTIAVLPFQNVGGPDEEYFSDGLTEELIAALSQLRSLRVAA